MFHPRWTDLCGKILSCPTGDWFSVKLGFYIGEKEQSLFPFPMNQKQTEELSWEMSKWESIQM